jgi:hypothetical protein
MADFIPPEAGMHADSWSAVTPAFRGGRVATAFKATAGLGNEPAGKRLFSQNVTFKAITA